ncbi:MAG TPA: NrdH-redoxin [Candidatus Vogelbacteria bacterium]|uniref:NrdH-redoxin n=1 Tax=Candidatus Vogelbacteria bacterium RIFOXYD1_FULL_51_18 TaxID=1802440 RepID=A0A1G2QKD5_9BACT|nr:MAG: Glutaredoxin-like protein, YruB-family [Parcubacteria group bacterium GW2011_GWC1_51_35]KKW24845.1 MAG: Glutaredoxin-like protein, YruB-family [Parcubacteria group bacterium GW2011_GWF2_52_12]OHA60918.1 MAG: NrdH-redoxin [Candidatus Vogelbacteria bacterium RIFOXYD1_FULL_51_18]HBB65068.1 NrdH-redoxin [Candidatus Vogelbacteria bacterium]HBC44004.1 NrdH-redoxin [Candidatus Vogelbacteria bacterium]
MHTVEMYTTPTCHFCHAAKEYFTGKGLSFTEYDVQSNLEKRKEMIEKTGQLGVPVIVIDKVEVVIGFDQPTLARLLGV